MVARPSRWLPAAVVLLSACELAAPSTGTPLGDGVAVATFEVRARHTDLVDVQVYFPADPDGAPSVTAAPAIVFVHGGFVGAERYRWLGQALAGRGFVVAMPAHPLDLAFFAIDNGAAARALLAAPPEGSLLDGAVDATRIGVAGHSLGGVVAVKLAVEGGFGALAVLASYPDPADDARLPSLALPSLSLAAEQDCQALLDEDVRPGFEKLPAPAALAVVLGATHYQFTDDDAPDVQRGCAPALPLAAAHDRMGRSLDAFFRAALAGEGTGATALALIEGVEVTAR